MWSTSCLWGFPQNIYGFISTQIWFLLNTKPAQKVFFCFLIFTNELLVNQVSITLQPNCFFVDQLTHMEWRSTKMWKFLRHEFNTDWSSELRWHKVALRWHTVHPSATLPLKRIMKYPNNNRWRQSLMCNAAEQGMMWKGAEFENSCCQSQWEMETGLPVGGDHSTEFG